MKLSDKEVESLNGGLPVHVEVPGAHAKCVLIREDALQELKNGTDEWAVDAGWAAFCEVAGPAGWDDPEMDIYDELYHEDAQ